MKKGIQIYSVLVVILVAGCFDPPEFENEPTIAFEGLVFKEVEQASDSLILSFTFQDGDGDIGLEANESFPPYHAFNVVIDSRDSLITFSDTTAVAPFFLVEPFVGGQRLGLFTETDQRPSYNCEDYFILEDNSEPPNVVDTFYVAPNPFNKNIVIDFFRKVNGEYVLMNDQLSASPNCPEDFDGRIPIFDRGNVGRALSGTINYSLLSQGWPLLFLSDTIMMRFFIYDRALNRSNVVETPDFVLADITAD